MSNSMTLGLSMIVKNEAHTLRMCLESMRGVVSQIVVADTGSTDGSANIAREFGAKVITIPWENDFAKARNAALATMQTDWVLVLDADEELDCQTASKIPQLIKRQGVGGYLTPIRNYVPTATGRGWDRAAQTNDSSHPRAKDAPAYFVHENCRLFRRNPEIYFIGRVHELVEHSIKAAGLKLLRSDVYIHHFGQLAAGEDRRKKAAAYLEMLRLKVRELPSDPMAWLQLGLQEYEYSHETAEPLRCFERALQLEPKAVQGWLFKGMIHLDSENYQQALADLDRVRSDIASRAFCEHMRGDALHNLGRLEEARESYAKSGKLTHGDPVVISKLGYTEVRLGRVQQGITKLKQAAESAPEVGEIRERLMKAYIATNQLLEAAEQAEQLAKIEGTPKSYLRAASIWKHTKQNDKAEAILQRGIELFPEAQELQKAFAELNDIRTVIAASSSGR
jgi:tetratricopeptide (TPR) repeat protein